MFKVFKGLSIFIFLIISLSFAFKVEASNAYFIWEKTVVDIPINSDLESYKDDYKLKLYVNGKESNDYTVEYEVNASTFSTVLTNKIGRYTVYYRAYSKSNYLSSVQAIVFNVVDITPPKIDLKSEIVTIDYGYKLSDYDWFSVTDDTCDVSEIIIKVCEENIIYNTLGTFPSKIIAKDIYNNTSEKDFMVKIIDKISPEILILKPLIFSYGEQIKISDYILCKDNYNNDITNRLEINGLDLSNIGSQEITLNVTDYSGNVTQLILNVDIIDNLSPVLTLMEKEIILDIECYHQYTEDYFLKYIFNKQDNYSKKEDIKIYIDVSKLRKKVEDYTIYFVAIDDNNNKSTTPLLVKLREIIGPNIKGLDEIKIEVGEEIDLLSLVKIEDIYDPEAYKRLEIDYGDFDINKNGVYEIKYTCFNTSGIYSQKVIKIIVGNGISSDNSKDKVDIISIISAQPVVPLLIIIFLVVGLLIIIVKKILLKKKQEDNI